jgi:multiple sugar transport system substrate-binding protein
MKRLSKALCILLSVLLLGVVLSACGQDKVTDNPTVAPSQGAEEETPEAAPVTIKFWNGFTASDGDILREIYDRFNAQNGKGITVEMDIMPWDNLFESLAPALATNTAPALLLLGSEYIPEYAASGGIVALDDFWSWSGLDVDNYLENVRETFVLDGTIYGIPMQYNTQYLYWNKDLFTAAGLDPEAPPKTFDEMVAYAEALTDASKEQYGMGIAIGNANITNFLWSNGGDWLNADQTKAVCNSPETVEVLTMLQGIFENGYSPIGMTGADLDNLLYAGQLGMYINGPWLINGCREAGLNFGIGAVPAANDGHLQVPGGGCAFMVTSSADEAQKEACYEAMKYWLSKDVLKEWSIKNGFPAWSQEVLADPEIQADPIQNTLGPLSQYGRLPFAGMSEYSQIAGDCLDPLYEKLMYGQITPEDCAAQMEEGINAILGK